MLKNRTFRWFCKAVIATVSFSVIFLTIQPFFVTQRILEGTVMVEGYSYLEKNSIDVLFLGSSQMYRTVDAGKLTHEYGISSYNFGSSAQTIPTTSYYMDEALKTQTPKLIVLEVCAIFTGNSDIPEKHVAYGYVPMPMSLKKFNSLHNSLDINLKKSFEYAFIPLILYHDRWRTIEFDDIDFMFNADDYIDLKARGYLAKDNIEKIEIKYYNGDEAVKKIPKESKKAILDIAEKCKKKGIKLLLFKAPVSYWTRGDSNSVKQFAGENNIDFIDLSDNLKEIGIDENTDFCDGAHLNISGAAKTTDYLAKILPAYLE